MTYDVLPAVLGWSKHVLGPGEVNDNPWVTVSPDGRWMVTGNYDPLEHLEVYPVPDASFGDVPLAATVPLDHPPDEVQGCDFVGRDRAHLPRRTTRRPASRSSLIDLDAPLGSARERGR